MGNIDKKIINTIYNNTISSINTLQHIYNKVEEENLKNSLKNRIDSYNKIANAIENKYNIISIGNNTDLYNRYMFTPEISINKSKKNINAVIKYIDNEFLDDSVKRITNMYISNENKNIQDMEKYL